MSLSGIAIAIGVLVDAGIVMTENVIRHCERAEEEKGKKVISAGVISQQSASAGPSTATVPTTPSASSSLAPTGEEGWGEGPVAEARCESHFIDKTPSAIRSTD